MTTLGRLDPGVGVMGGCGGFERHRRQFSMAVDHPMPSSVLWKSFAYFPTVPAFLASPPYLHLSYGGTAPPSSFPVCGTQTQSPHRQGKRRIPDDVPGLELRLQLHVLDD